ncbi:LysE family translocator [Pseudodesulfovibrio tunisiensis]|uniref:LysE family translocator n=1 Tax=Pseudodesulfovibrio tunisiensis TaxID=463192 RepID=UPI001FB4EB3F|nr:LysE family translocator [Pseudodesulfovibrio tunisiensis]
MTPHSTLALALATMLFALIPGPGVAAMVTQSLTRGFSTAALWAVGMALGDLVYLLTAIFGLGWMAEQFGSGFLALKYAGAAYLIHLGVRHWTSRPLEIAENAIQPRTGRLRSLAAGLSISLSNPKVIAFYCGFLPGFMDLKTLTPTDVLIAACTVISSIVSVLLCYAWLASKGRSLLRSTRAWKILNRSAGAVMIGAGIAVASD